jgi:hypothetical protein
VLLPSHKHTAGGRGSGQAANPFAIILLPQTKRAAQVELRPPFLLLTTAGGRGSCQAGTLFDLPFFLQTNSANRNRPLTRRRSQHPGPQHPGPATLSATPSRWSEYSDSADKAAETSSSESRIGSFCCSRRGWMSKLYENVPPRVLMRP